MVHLTRRNFLEGLAVFGASVATGVGLVGLLQGCEQGEQKPTWKEAKEEYMKVEYSTVDVAGQTRNYRVHKGTFADRMRWLTENRKDEETKQEILRLWVLAEQGNDPATTYTEVVLPGIRDYVDFYFRRVMETPWDDDRYQLAGEQLRNLDLLLFKLQNQIQHRRLVVPPETLRGDSALEGTERNGTRTIYEYHRPELDALREARGKWFDEHASNQLTREEYLALIAPLTSDPNLVIKTTYQPGR